MFILNVVHRPEMVPEYAEKNGNKSEILVESLNIFKLQQEIAHKNGIKTTIQMTYASLFNEEAIATAKEHHRVYGDEISLTLLGLPCEQFNAKYRTKEFCIWMFSMEDKMAIVDDVFGKFYEVFGFYPSSTGSYYMDAELITYIKGKYPSVVCAVATCWEEGPKAYRTCNNSWYTLFDGGPWNPWIPSRQNTHAPAADESEDNGIVAIPHLSRDLIACFDGNGSNFGTHPQNVLRGMIYQDDQYPYLYNIIDQYRAQDKYNDGYSYNMMFVGPGWMNKNGRWEASYELLVKSYEDGMAYYGELKKQNALTDMTMTEFAGWYRKNKSYKSPEAALWKDILYGSEKQYFWYSDPYMRLCADMNQGGALIDLRPYAAKIRRPVGIGTKHVQDASYPFLVQSMYRAGYFTHYAGEGTIKSCRVKVGGEEADLCLTRTSAKVNRNGKTLTLTIEPVEIVFSSVSFKVGTTYTFEEGASKMKITRKAFDFSEPATVEIDEYITACYGTTEYPEDMTSVTLSCGDGAGKVETIEYAYKCRDASVENGRYAEAIVGAIDTRLTVTSEQSLSSYIREGYAFSPMFSLGLKAKLSEGEELVTWLNLEKAS